MNGKDLDKFWSPAFDDMRDFVFLIDGKFKIAKCNRSFLEATGKERTNVEGNSCYSCVHARNEPIRDCPHRRLLESQRYEEGEIFEPTLDKWLFVRTTPIFDDGGEIMGSIHIASDVTDSKRAEEKLQENFSRIKSRASTGS